MKVILLDNVPSTNNYATELLRIEEVEEGTIFLTFRQTSGRGQGRNVWESEDYKNLTFSLILKPHFLPASSQFLISQVVSTGIVAALDRVIDDVRIKWPNDILLGMRKLCGILIENSIIGSNLDWTVVGVGLNVNQDRFANYNPEAVSLKQILGRTLDTEALLFSIFDEIMSRYSLLKEGKENEIVELYYQRLFRMGEWWKYRKDGIEFEAKITGTDEFGRLMLEDRSGDITHWPFKGVEMVWT
jgi:BirA family biotin operon repressor/biotin-[acetyl-CoA-carboxylase] ligase